MNLKMVNLFQYNTKNRKFIHKVYIELTTALEIPGLI